jgi:hypothetical protein
MRELDTFTVATQGLISTLFNIDKDRQEYRREDQAEKCVLRNLGPPQLVLVKRLCTTRYSVPGEYNEGALTEIQVGWKLDCRCLLAALPSDKDNICQLRNRSPALLPGRPRATR